MKEDFFMFLLSGSQPFVSYISPATLWKKQGCQSIIGGGEPLGLESLTLLQGNQKTGGGGSALGSPLGYNGKLICGYLGLWLGAVVCFVF